MSLTLDIPAELAAELAAEAARRQMPVQDYAVQLLATRSTSNPRAMSGGEVVAYWRQAGLVGTRQDITDAHAQARRIRDQAQRRERS
jgi:hypothetical protein